MRKSISIIVLTVTVAFLTAFSVANVKPNKGYRIGDVVEDFSLQNIDGAMVSLADYKKAKGFIIIFTCNTCPYAVMYEDRIIALNKKYAHKGYPVIAIMPNNTSLMPGDSFDAMKQRALDKGFTFPYLINSSRRSTLSLEPQKHLMCLFYKIEIKDIPLSILEPLMIIIRMPEL